MNNIVGYEQADKYIAIIEAKCKECEIKYSDFTEDISEILDRMPTATGPECIKEIHEYLDFKYFCIKHKLLTKEGK